MSRVAHFELQVVDVEAARRFFADVFSWDFSRWEGPQEYWLVSTGRGENDPGIDGGLMAAPDGQPRTVNTVDVESVDAALRKVLDAGGQVVVPKTAVPGVGWLAYCSAPGGALFGVMQIDSEAG